MQTTSGVQTTPSHGRRYSLRYVLHYGLRAEKVPILKKKSTWIFFHFKNLVQPPPSHGRRYSLRHVPPYGLHSEIFPIMKNKVGFFSTLKSF